MVETQEIRGTPKDLVIDPTLNRYHQDIALGGYLRGGGG